MGLLFKAQEIHGDKTFKGTVTIEGDLVLRRACTYFTPKSSERSSGTAHDLYQTILSTDPSATSVQTLNVRTWLPTSARRCRGTMGLLGATIGRRFSVCDSTGTNLYGTQLLQVANQTSYNWFDTPIDAGGNIYWQASNADITAVVLIMVSYDT